MTYIEAKKKLHDYIDSASEKEVMEIVSLVEQSNTDKYIFDEASLRMLNERSEAYLSGREKTYLMEESMQRIKAQRKKNEL